MGRKRRTSPQSPKREQPRKKRSSARKTRPGGSGPARPRSSDRPPTQNQSATRGELAALRERAAHLQRLFEQAPLGYQSLDADGRLLDVNRAWLELLGYERVEALGRYFEDFMTPTSRAAFRERFPEFLAAGEIRRAERELVRKDGTVVTVSIDGRVERDHYPSPRTHCLLRDVTDQRRAVEALRQRETAYRRLVENISDALIVDDLEGRIVYANDRFLELFGFTRAELSSIRLGDYVAPSCRARLREYHERRVRGESVPERFEYEGLRRDGTTLWLEVRVTPVEEGGRIIGTQSLIRDVTASKRTEDDLRRTTELLESVRAAQAAFITHGDARPVFASLLRTLVSLTGSEFGFLDEVLRDADGTRYKLSLALSNIAWSPEAERLYAQLEARQLEFRKLHNLAGLPAVTGEPLITNDAPNDPRAGGLPPGHPPIHTFMGLPLYFDGEVVGVAGMANRVGGYDERLARFLEPFLSTCASIIHALRAKARQDETTRALRASEERYSRIVETAYEGIVSLDTAQRITFANARLAEMLGVTPSELIGRPFTDFLFAEDLADHQARMRRRRQGQSATYECRFRRRDGSAGWALVSGTALHDEHGQFAGSFGMFTDITERKRAELALRESEDTRRALLNAATDSSVLIDVNGTILAINEVGARRLNRTVEQVVGRNIYTFLPPHLAESRQARVEEVLRTGRPVCFEDERAGMRMEHHVHPIADPDGVVRKLAIFARDVTAARQAEAALRAAEADKALILNTTREMFARYDLDLRIVWANKASGDSVGLPAEALVGRHCYELWGEGHQPCPDCPVLRAMETRRPQESERVSSDGRVWFLRACPVLDADGEVTGTVEFGQDITERRRAEEALHDREEQYRTLVANIPGVVYRCEVDPPWRVQFCSEKALEVIGYSAADFMSDKVLYGTLIHPDDLPAAKGAVAEAVGSGRPFAVEHRLIHPDGTLRWMLVRGQAHYDGAGRPLWLDGILHDVTASKQAEQERAQLAAAIEQAGEAIVITDPAGTIRYVNAGFERITGYRRAEAIGRNLRILGGRHDAAFYQDPWQTLTAGRVWHGRFVNRRKDGTLYDEEAVLAPVRDARGQITNFVAVERDITEELSLAEQIRQAQKMEAIGQLAAGVAHDFNNLLTALLGYVGIARQAGAPDAAISEALEGIENLAVHAVGITKSLLMFSGRSQATLEPVNLGTLLAETAKLLHHIVPRAVTLRIIAPADEPLWVQGDRAQLQQVILNLTINARDAMPDGGELTIGLAPLADDEAPADGTPPLARPAVCLSVRDTGCGMSPETQARIFEPFFTTKPRGRGTGLGLPIVFGIVKEHRGYIDVRSAPGQGSAFRVILPRIPAPASAPPEGPPTAPEPRGRGELILLAEDNEYVRALLVTELERLGFSVAAAADGEELMRLYEERRPAVRLLVLDFDLPRQTGGQCLRQIRCGGDRVPAVLISGAEEARRRLDDPEAHRLNKPFTLPQFAEAVYLALASAPQSEVLP